MELQNSQFNPLDPQTPFPEPSNPKKRTILILGAVALVVLISGIFYIKQRLVPTPTPTPTLQPTPPVQPPSGQTIYPSQFRFDPQSSGQSQFTGPQTNKLKWAFRDQPSPGCMRQVIITTPVLDEAGNLYFGTSEGSLIALSPAGREIWRFKIPDSYPRNNCVETGKASVYDYNIGFMPALDNTGTIYFGTSGIGNAKKIYALNKNNGTKKWEFSIDGPLQSHIRIGYNNKLYFATTLTLYELNTNGEKISSYPAGGKWNVPAIAKDGTVYACSNQGLVALDSNLNKKWIYSTNNPLNTCQPTVDPKTGIIYFPEKNLDKNEYKLTALNPDGTLKWSVNTFWIESPATAAEDGTIYVGTVDLSKDTKPTSYPIQQGNGILFAFNPNGQEKWRYYVPPVLVCKKGSDEDCPDSDLWKNARAIDISPSIGKDGTIYFGSDVGLYIALNSDGETVKWVYQEADEWDNTAMIAPDGTLYVGHGGGLKGGLYAFSDSAAPPGESPDNSEEPGGR